VISLSQKVLPEDQDRKLFRIDLEHHTCDCGRWQASGIPCAHALAIIRHRGENDLQFDYAVFIILADENIRLAEGLLQNMSEEVHLEIRIFEGDFMPTSLPFVNEDWAVELKPTPGRSVGPDVRDLAAIGKTVRYWASQPF
jgi:hypothetical protein